jgi:SSS family solute:Na+ symporter
MTPTFGTLDWCEVALYGVALVVTGLIFTPRKTSSANEYFLAGGQIPSWLAAISVLSATQSAATFLGAPDYGYRGDYTYLSMNIAALMAAWFVATVLIPRYYALGVTTVYELLDVRFGKSAKHAAGGMFLIGRVLAGGARVYLGAIAISMIINGSASAQGIAVASIALVFVSFAFTFTGGLKTIIWSDLAQFVIYVGAAVCILIFLWTSIPSPDMSILHGLAATPDGHNKLRVLNWSFNATEPFSLIAVVTGGFLLMVGNFGLDQDTTQRLLACKSAREGARGAYLSVLITILIVWIFISIGELLYVFYERADLMHRATAIDVGKTFHGQDVSVFMYFILTEIPSGLRGLAAVGIIAAAVSTTNSAMNAMSSVLVQDFYRPWRERHAPTQREHYVLAGRVGMAVTGILMLGTAILSFYWQHAANMGILEFVLSIMTYAYAGLLGVYFTVIFTERGSTTSVIVALAVGFVTILCTQKQMIDALGLPVALKTLAFPWQLCIGTTFAFVTCVTGRMDRQVRESVSAGRGCYANH